jgi:hypothetical protein
MSNQLQPDRQAHRAATAPLLAVEDDRTNASFTLTTKNGYSGRFDRNFVGLVVTVAPNESRRTASASRPM